MFLELWEREEQAKRLQRARAALAEVGLYPTRTIPPKRKAPLDPRTANSPRGVYEVEFPPAGHRAFNIVNSAGEAGYVQFPTHWVTRDFVKNLWRRLDALDPVAPTLELVKHRGVSE